MAPKDQATRAPDRTDAPEAGKPRPEGRIARATATMRRHPFISVLAALIVAGGLVYGVLWWLDAQNYVSTDDARIATHVVTISPQVSAAITAVPVHSNELVAAGAPLVRLDPRDYQAALEQAKAQVEAANANIAVLTAQVNAQQLKIKAAELDVDKAKAALDFARQQSQRYQALAQNNAGTNEQAQQAQSTLQQSQAAYNAAQANAQSARQQTAVLQAQTKAATAKLHQAQAAVDQASANLSRVTIDAPGAGYVTSLSAVKGEVAQVGQALMMIVPKTVWLAANFKETQIGQIRPGQPVTIHVDAYPGRTFHGHVQSIQAGSGSAFSLLPAENATGNFVKVVQRVPVKIVFDKQPDVLLGPGMSAEPTVKVQ